MQHNYLGELTKKLPFFLRISSFSKDSLLEREKYDCQHLQNEFFKAAINYLDIHLQRSPRAFQLPVYLHIQVQAAQVIHPFQDKGNTVTYLPENNYS